ncbi:zinc finger, CCHC-type containing protein [Tanacetum coccineum]
MWGNFSFDYSCSMARGRSGGLISIRDPNSFVKELFGVTSFYYRERAMENSVGDCFMVNIYVPQDSADKLILWNRLTYFMHRHNGSFILFGDLNVVRNNQERLGSIVSRLEVVHFNSFIDSTSLVDLPIGARLYTWMNKADTKLSKLGRFLIFEDDLEALPDIRITTLDWLWSDHNPILLHFIKLDFGLIRFKLYNLWLSRDSFDDLIKSEWTKLEGNINGKSLKCHEKFRSLKTEIKQWNVNVKATDQTRKQKHCQVQQKGRPELGAPSPPRPPHPSQHHHRCHHQMTHYHNCLIRRRDGQQDPPQGPPYPLPDRSQQCSLMAVANQNTNNTTIRYEKKIKFVKQPIGPAPDPETANSNTIDKYYEFINLEQEVACLMLSSMSPDLQRILDKYNAFEMMNELKTMFEEQAKQKLFEIVKAFHACKQEDGQSNYNMHSIGKTLAELHAMLKLHEKGIPKKAETPAMLDVREGKIQKDKKKPQGAKGKGNGKNKLAYAPKAKILLPPKRDPTKDSICHHYKEVGHWRKNCPSYHVELKKRKNASVASTSGIFTIELYAFPNKTWVYDTGCGTLICNTSQGNRESRKLKHGALSLYMGNGMRAAVEAIRSFDLILPSGLIIVLDNFHFAPTVTRGVISISCLVNNGYIHTFTNYSISGSKDNVFYFNAIPRDGIYEIDMHNLYPNVSSMVSERRNHTLLDMVQSTMNLTTMPKSFWGCALEAAARILNMVSTKKIERMPYEIWHEKASKLSYLRVWGCEALVKRDMPDKLDSRSINTELFENSFMVQEASGSHGLLQISGSDKGLELIQEEDIQPFKNTSKHIMRYGYYVDIEGYELGDFNEPPNYKAALADPECDKWLETMNTERQSIRDNQVWYLVDLLSNGRTVGWKWLFKMKTDIDGNVHTFKARLVAKGFTQTYRVHYRETFSPVADIRVKRILLAIATFYDYEIWQMDVKTTFLTGRVCGSKTSQQSMQTSMFHLKQASISWNKKFDEEIKKIGFT